MSKYISILSVLVSLFCLLACEQTLTNFNDHNYTLELSRDTLLFNLGGGMKSVEIKTNQEWWEATDEELDWYSLKEFHEADGYEMITVSVDSSTVLSSRESKVNVTAGSYQQDLYIIQLGNEPSMLFSSDSVIVDKDTTILELDYVSNIDFEIDNNSVWMQFEKATHNGEERLRVFISPNETGNDRENLVVLKQTDGDYSMNLYFRQLSVFSEYEATNVDGIKGNKLIPVLSGIASTTLPGFELANAYDGDYETYFQSDWQESAPIEFSFKLDAGDDLLNYIMWHPALEASSQSVNAAEVYLKKVGEPDFSYLMTTPNLAQSRSTLIMLDEPLTNVDEVKFVVTRTFADYGTIPAASVAEVEFYTTSTIYDNIFTDLTCSELLSSVSMEDILNIEDAFYRNLAKHLYNGTYEMARINDLEAINQDRSHAKINHASSFENATGIYFAGNEEVVVFCGKYPGAAPSLIVLNANGYNEYELLEGVNVLHPSEGGKVYINNPTSVKIHIAGGLVEGVYTNDILGQIQNFNGESYNVVDVFGVQTHVLMPSAYAQEKGDAIQTFQSNIAPVIEAAKRFYGVAEGTYQAHSRLGFYINEDDVEVTTLINLTSEEFDAICNFTGEYNELVLSVLEKIGNAYEPYITKLWGMEDVSSRLFALTYFYHSSALSIIHEDDYYRSAIQDIIVVDKNYLNIDSEWSKVVPLWQLWHYLKEVKGIDDYYAQLTYKVKALSSINEYTKHFTEYTNQVSGMDFTTFFNQWNMVSPSTKPAILAPGALAYYIEDNQALYTTVNPLGEGTFYPSLGGYPALYGYENLTAIEVYNAGFLAHVETYQTSNIFKVTWDKYQSNMKIVAVGADGETINVN